MSELSIFLSSV